MSGLPKTCGECPHVLGPFGPFGDRCGLLSHALMDVDSAPPTHCPLRSVSPTVPKGEEPSEENVYTATEVRRLLVAAWHQTHSSPLNAESLADSLLRCATPRRAAPPSAPPEPIDEVVKRLEKWLASHGWYPNTVGLDPADIRALIDHARLRGDRR